jgi:Zn finger protein HypA/HybF involved in hydrogenase expression
MTEVHTDGNGIAGLLSEVFAVEVTTVQRRCHSCGAENALGAHRAYHGAGVVLRCPACADVAMRIGVAEDRLVLEWRGNFTAPRAP